MKETTTKTLDSTVVENSNAVFPMASQENFHKEVGNCKSRSIDAEDDEDDGNVRDENNLLMIFWGFEGVEC
jgi:hypothetical protein